MKNLHNVCLITIDGVGDKTNQLDEIVQWCNYHFKFKTTIRITCDDAQNIKENSYVKIPKLNYYEYNKLCVNNLYDFTSHVDFTHCLLVQEDGFIVNPDLWDDAFLNYDYIGAPWLKYDNEDPFPWVKQYGIKCAVGNGGFTLRSKRLLKECKPLLYEQNYPNEDVFICANAGDYLRSKDLIFADINTAARFSLETKNYINDSLNNCFGFHGKSLLNDGINIMRKYNGKN